MLQVHKRLHSGDKPYNCDFCNRPFRQWGDLKYHIQSKHSKDRSHQCEFCGKDFARRYSLVIHRRIHTGEKVNQNLFHFTNFSNLIFLISFVMVAHIFICRITNVNSVTKSFVPVHICRCTGKSTLGRSHLCVKFAINGFVFVVI